MDCPGERGQEQQGNGPGCWTAGGNQGSAGMSAVSAGGEVESALTRNIS